KRQSDPNGIRVLGRQRQPAEQRMEFDPRKKIVKNIKAVADLPQKHEDSMFENPAEPASEAGGAMIYQPSKQKNNQSMSDARDPRSLGTLPPEQEQESQGGGEHQQHRSS